MATVPVPFGLFSGVFFKLFLTVSVFYFVTDLWTLTQHNLPEHSVRKIISGRSLSLLIPVSIGFLGGISWPLCACVSIMASGVHFTAWPLCACVSIMASGVHFTAWPLCACVSIMASGVHFTAWPLCACVSIMASEVHFTLLDLCVHVCPSWPVKFILHYLTSACVSIMADGVHFTQGSFAAILQAMVGLACC